MGSFVQFISIGSGNSPTTSKWLTKDYQLTDNCGW